MLPSIYSFKKSFEKRLQEYDFLRTNQELCCNVSKVWAFDLECAIDRANWHALWQMSEENCIEFKALFPTTVVVKVIKIIFAELTACVTVEGVQDDLAFPDTLYVPLFDLFPTQVPRPSHEFIRLRNIADWLDRCRFFFLYLWYHWDGTSDKKRLCEWASEHLENRLQLQYDIRNGILDRITSSYIQDLLTDAVRVADAIAESEESELDSEQKMAMVKNYKRQEDIKIELQLFEAPDLRSLMVAYIQKKKQLPVDNSVVTIIMPEIVTILAADQIFERARASIPTDSQVRILNNAQHALASSPASATFFIAPGIHSLENLGGLSFGGTIRGLCEDPEKTVLVSAVTEPKKYIFLSCHGSVKFQNLTVTRSEGVLVSAVEGVVRFENCHFTGDPGCLARGIVVQKGCRLELINCILSNLGTAIIAQSLSSVNLTSTTIKNCAEGVKAVNEVNVSLTDSVIENASVAAVVLETSAERNATVGEITIFSDFVTVNNTKFINNTADAKTETLPREIVIE